MLPLLFISPSRKETLPCTFIPYRYNRRHPSQPCRKYAIPVSDSFPASYAYPIIQIPQIAQAISCSVRHSGAMFRQFPSSRSQRSRLLCKTKVSCHKVTLAGFCPTLSFSVFPFSFLHSSTRHFSCQGEKYEISTNISPQRPKMKNLIIFIYYVRIKI